MKTILVRCKGHMEVALSEIEALQESVDGHNLKALSDARFGQLRSSLETRGFWFPFFVWRDEKEKLWVLDGTQREKVLQWMAARPAEYTLPERYPAVLIDADSRTEAAEAVLLQSGAYGKITQQGLFDFITDNDVNFDDLMGDLSLPDINMGDFKINWLDHDPEEAEQVPNVDIQGDVDGRTSEYLIVLFPDRPTYEAAIARFGLSEGARSLTLDQVAKGGSFGGLIDEPADSDTNEK